MHWPKIVPAGDVPRNKSGHPWKAHLHGDIRDRDCELDRGRAVTVTVTVAVAVTVTVFMKMDMIVEMPMA